MHLITIAIDQRGLCTLTEWMPGIGFLPVVCGLPLSELSSFLERLDSGHELADSICTGLRIPYKR